MLSSTALILLRRIGLTVSAPISRANGTPER
jgi:hypothetical protein